MSNLNQFEQHVIAQLATLEERTRDVPEIRRNVTAIATKVASLETRASIFGAAAGAILAAAITGFKHVIGKG